MTYNTIALKCDGKHEESVAIAALKPGHLLVKNSSGVKKHPTAGGKTPALFAKESALNGKTISDAYAAADWVPYVAAVPGDIVYARLKIGENVSIGDTLVSGGDGSLIAGRTSDDIYGPLYESVAASAAVTNTVTETAFDKSYAIPANTLNAGDVIRVRAQAIATSTNSTDTLNLKLRVGGTTICATGAVDVANNDIGLIVAEVTIRTIGASGTMVAAGTTSLGASGTVTAKAFNLASTAVDTTTALTVDVTATWSVASASNSCRLDELIIELVGGGLSAGGSAANAIAYAEEAKDNSAGSDEAMIAVRVA